jgi:plastocyanin
MKLRWCSLAACLAVVTLGGTAPSRADTIRIVIDQLQFTPAVVTAAVGDTIEWVNRDALDHTATVTGEWEVMIPADETGTLILKKGGSIEYFCRFHPNMTGRIDVIAKQAPAPG